MYQNSPWLLFPGQQDAGGEKENARIFSIAAEGRAAGLDFLTRQTATAQER